MFKSKKTAWLTIAALLVPTTAGLFGSSAAQAADVPTTLSTFTVNGTDVLTSNTLSVDVATLNVSETGVLSADVVATATDTANTTVTITGDSGLVVGSNTLSVRVAASWTEQVQNPNYVPARTEANPDYRPAVIDDPETTDVDETAPAQGEPTITYPAQGTEFTTESRTASQTYTRTINVLNNDTGSVITVNEEEVANGDGVEVDWGTLSVPVTVTPSDSNATVKVNGTLVGLVSGVATTSATGLTTGENTITVLVAAPNGETDESLLTVTVLPNTDASAVITIDGIIAEDGDEVPLDFGSTDPDIEVYTADEDATYVVDGGSDLIPGENRVEIFVTAADGVTVQIFRLTLLVQLDNDTTAAIYVNGVERSEGDEIVLPYQTTSVAVVVEVADSDSSYVIDGSSELMQGTNDLLVTVYAADNVTSYQYAFTLLVSDPDVTLKTLKLNGNSVTENSTVSSSSSKNTLLLEATDSRATIAVDGGSYNPTTGALVLANGSNDITVTVTGDDKATTRDYLFTVNVNLDLTLKTFKFNGTTIANNGSATTWSASNNLTLEANDSRSTITVDNVTYNPATGSIQLIDGQNDVTVTVTGDDGESTEDYVITLGKYDIKVKWEGNNEDVSVIENEVVNVPGNVESVEVTATEPFDGWKVEVEGNTDLAFGSNTVAVTYTSPENVEVLKTFTVFVGDADLSAAIEVNDEAVVFDANGTGVNGTVSLEESPASAAVVVETADTRSTYVVTGGSALNVGANTITVVVTGADDKTRTYTITVTVIASTDTEITGKFVNGEAISEEGDFTEVTAGVISIDIDTADVNATSRVTVAPTAGTFGGWATTTNGVITGSGFLTVTVVVTAEDGVTVGDAETFNILATKDFDVTSGSNPVTDTLRVGTYAKSTPATVAAWFPQGAKLNYQWLLDGEVISGATTSRLLLTAEHYGEAVVRPVVSQTVAGVTKSYIGQALDVSLGIIPLASVPGITGKPQLGNTLKVATKKWTADVELTISWYVDGQLSDVTGEEFVLNESNVNAGETVKARVTGELDGYETLYKESALLTVTPGTLRITEKPSIAAGANGYVVGEKITITSGKSSNLDADENIQWYRNGVALFNETDSEYEITAADVSKKLTAVVTYSLVNYADASITLKAGAIKVGTLDQPDAATIIEDGTTKLTAILGYDNTVVRSSVKYIWYRNGRAVLGQNTSSYTLTSKDAGATISVRVTATYPGYKSTVTVTTGDDNYKVD